MQRVLIVCRTLFFIAVLQCLVNAHASRAEKAGEDPHAPPEESEEATPPEIVIDVVVAGTFYEPCFERFKEAGEARGIALSVTFLPRDGCFEEVRDLLERGDVDLLLIPPVWLPGLVESGLLLPFDDPEGTQDAGHGDIFLPMLDLFCRFDGRLYALPLDGDVRLFYYRKDLLEDHAEKSAFEREYGYTLSVPKSGMQAVDFSRFFTRKMGAVLAGEVLTHDFYGVGMALGPGWCHYEWLDRFLTYGGIYFDDDLRPLIADKRGVRAIEDLKRLFEYAPPAALTWGYREVKEAFVEGRIASLVLWSDLFKLVYDAEHPSIEGRVGVSHVPGRMVNGGFDFRALMSGGGVMAVASSSGKPDSAFWVASAMSTNSARFVFDPRTRCDPFRYSQVACPHALSETLSAITGSRISEEDAAEYLDAVRESMEHGVPALAIPSSDDYIDLLDLYVHRALAGEMEPALALERAARKWDEISREYGYEVQKKSWRSVYAAWERLYPFE